jgi:hypothetical protein
MFGLDLLIPLIISAIASAGGAYLQYDAQRDAQKRQRREIEAAQDEQEEFDRRRQAQVLENAVKVAADPQEQLQRVVQPAQERLEGVAQQAAQTTAQSASRPVGASSRYDTEMAKRAAAELERAILEAGMAARAGGGRQMMFEQGLTNAQGASDVDNLVSIMQQAARNSRTRIDQAGNVNSGQMLAGGLIQAAGPAIGAGVGGAFGTTVPAAPADPNLGNFGTLTGNPMLSGQRSAIPQSSFGSLTGMRVR